MGNEKKIKKSDNDEFFITQPTEGLKHRSVRAGTLTVASQFAKLVLQTLATALLARILLPEDFGLIAMVVAITNFALFIGDLGLVSATIQRKNITHSQVNAMFWVNVAFGAALSLILLMLSPLIARFYHEPRLTYIVVIIGVTFLFGGLSAQHLALLRRQMKFTQIAVTDVLSLVIGIAVAIVMAMHGWKYWALVWQTFFQSLSSTSLLWFFSRWRPSLPKWDHDIPSMIAFGGHLTGSNLLNYFSRNLDNLLIGWILGPSVLGLYSKAYNILMVPIRQINAPITSVALPAVSQLQENAARFNSYILNLVSMAAIFTVPLVIYTIVDADNIVLLLLGKDWIASAEIFRNLGPAALVGAISFIPGLLLVSTARTKLQLKLSFWSAIVIVSSFCLGIIWGANGVAIAYSITYTIMFSITLFVACSGSPVRFSAVVGRLSMPLLAGCISALILAYVKDAIAQYLGILILKLIVDFLLFILVFFIVLVFSIQGREDIRRLINIRHSFASKV